MGEKTAQSIAKDVLRLESEAILQQLDHIDASFDQAIELIQQCDGRVVVLGVGKSGHIGSKIAASLASTGTPAFFVHPGEASHGDLGMITPKDITLALSNSGETPEILVILPILKRMGVRTIALTGKANSSLAQQSEVTINVSVDKEACPLNLAPTSSTTATLAIGDALTVALLELRGFTSEDFARSHPGGALGRRLLLYVKDIMHKGDAIPIVSENTSFQDALIEMSSKGLGMTAVIDDSGKLSGIFTDGDLRRTLNDQVDIYQSKIVDLMTKSPVTVNEDLLAAEVVTMIQDNNINGVFVIDNSRKPVGALNTLDLIRAGIF